MNFKDGFRLIETTKNVIHIYFNGHNLNVRCGNESLDKIYIILLGYICESLISLKYKACSNLYLN